MFKDTKDMSANEKSTIYAAWIRFVNSGFKEVHFTKALYKHITLHCSFIAHYNRGTFYDLYFKNVDMKERFIQQFVTGKACEGCFSDMWLRGGNDYCQQFYDINTAMVNYCREVMQEAMV
jgi:hypothetical protein